MNTHIPPALVQAVLDYEKCSEEATKVFLIPEWITQRDWARARRRLSTIFDFSSL